MADLDINLALKIIPEFDGSSENLHRFLSCSDMVHESLKNTEINKFLNLLKVKLVGKAYEILKFEEFQKWKDLKAALKAQFSSKRSLESIQVELNSVTQQRFEEVKAFSNRVETLLFQLNEACLSEPGIESVKDIKKINNKMALRSFQEGLQDPIKLLVKACRFPTLKEAITKALEEEAIQKYSTSNYSSSSKPFSQQPKQVFSNFGNVSKCQLCNKIGHKASTCFKLQSSNNSNQNKPFLFSNVNDSTYTRNHTNNSTCAYCHNKGHHIQNCIKRQVNEKKRLKEQNVVTSSPLDTGNLQGSEQLGTPRRIRNNM